MKNKLIQNEEKIPELPSETILQATEHLAKAVDKDHGTKNGSTALYWHLVSVITKHMGKNPCDKSLIT